LRRDHGIATPDVQNDTATVRAEEVVETN
jgi:hypothetical protein